MNEVTEFRFQPHNVEAEQAVLGALLLNNEIFDRMTTILDEADFYDPVHARLWAHATRLIQQGQHASSVTMIPFVRDEAGLDELGGSQYLNRLAGATISIEVAPMYAESIKDLSRRRSAIVALDEALQRVCAMDDLNETSSALLDVLSEASPEQKTSVTLGDAVHLAAQRIHDARNGTRLPGIDLQIPELTELIGNAQAGDMVLLAGRPSMGKSAVAAEIARRCVMRDIAIVYWCGEMAPEDNAERILSAAARDAGMGVPYNLARQGKIGDEQERSLLEAGVSMHNLPFVFIESSIKSIKRLAHETRRHARRFQKQGRDVLLVFDYLQMASADARSKYEEVSLISRTLKDLAVELRCASLVLAQLSRAVETRDDKRPMLSDLRDSGQIEQDANTVIFCYRDEYYIERMAPPKDDEAYADHRAALERRKGEMELIVAKQRSGPLGTAHVGFEASTNSIYQLPQEGYGS